MPNPKLLAATAALLLASCDTAGSPIGASSPRVETTPSATSATNCRLPVVKYGPVGINSAPGPTTRVNGFLNVCSGQFAADPDGTLAVASPRLLNMTLASPVLYGRASSSEDVQATYVRQQHRWVPVAPNQVSPVGSRYVYLEPVLGTGGQQPGAPVDHLNVNVVDIATGQSRTVHSEGPSFFDLVRFDTAGIYITTGCGQGGCFPGAARLKLLDPDSGVLKPIGTTGATFWQVSGGVAWGRDEITDPQGPQHIIRLNLASGASSVWYSGPYVTVYEVDTTGHPLVLDRTTNGSFRLVRLLTPDSNEVVADFPTNVDAGSFLTEPSGTWFGAANQLYVYSPPSPPRSVVQIKDYVYRAEGHLGA